MVESSSLSREILQQSRVCRFIWPSTIELGTRVDEPMIRVPSGARCIVDTVTMFSFCEAREGD